MKRAVWFIPAILACILTAYGAYTWATGLIGSLYNFRSPLHSNPPQAGPKVGPALTDRVVLVLIDALRQDTSMNPPVMPYLNELRSQGAWATMHSRPPSFSDPAYSVLLTGAWPDISDGPAMNLDYADTPAWTQDNIFSAVHRAGLGTAVSGYYWFEKLIPEQDVSKGFYTPGEDAAADQDVLAAALPMLAGPYAFVLIHIDQVDYAGHHLGGTRDPRWNEAAGQADAYVREIAARLDFEKDTLIVLSDHGQIDRGGHGGQDPTTLVEPYIMVGAGVRKGPYPDIQQVDVAPTIAVLLGTNIPASNQGHPLVSMLQLPEQEVAPLNEALLRQQALLEETYLKAIGRPPAEVSVSTDQDVVSAYQKVMDQGRQVRLDHERIGRSILAVLIALFLAGALFLLLKKKLLWLFSAGLLYILLFNLIYALIQGRTYSLSSVASQTDIIVAVGGDSALSLVISWGLLMLFSRSFRHGPFPAASTTLSFTWICLYLLALPVLVYFALNGALIDWTLPDLLSMFIGFLSIMQLFIVAAIGLVLSGLAALTASLIPKAKRLD